jgi:hypothetical protein
MAWLIFSERPLIRLAERPGQRSEKIVNSCTDVIVGPAKLLKCQSLAYGGVSDGDSGSPVWRPADGGALAPQRFDPEQEVYVLGILWGQTVDINGEDQFFFSSTWGMFFDHALTGCCSSLSMVWY